MPFNIKAPGSGWGGGVGGVLFVLYLHETAVGGKPNKPLLSSANLTSEV